jgi:hypothetical protein
VPKFNAPAGTDTIPSPNANTPTRNVLQSMRRASLQRLFDLPADPQWSNYQSGRPTVRFRIERFYRSPRNA